jgi:hypothetical protein
MPRVFRDRAAAIARARKRLGHFESPKHVEFATLSEIAAGKIRQLELRVLEWANRDAHSRG